MVMALLDIDQAAEFLRMGKTSVRELAQAGKIPGTKLVDKWIFSESQLTEYVESLAKLNVASRPQIEPTKKPSTKAGRKRNPSLNQ